MASGSGNRDVPVNTRAMRSPCSKASRKLRVAGSTALCFHVRVHKFRRYDI